MKAKTLLYAAVVAAVSLSCTREAEESGLLNSGIEMEFTAEWADEKGADSRTILQEDGTSIWWSANEEINVFIGKDVSAKFVSSNTQPQRLVSFVGNVLIGAAEQEDSFPGYWAVYPYNAENSCDGQCLTLSLPYIQKGKENGFADKFFPSVARSNNFMLSFWNVCGGARFSVTREGVKRIVFKSNDVSPMAGKVKVGFGEDNKPQILEFTEPVDSVVVNAPEGGFIPGTNYFVAMLPQTHGQGLSVTLWMADKKADKTITQSVSIHRSAFGLLNEIDKGLEFVDAVFPDDPSPEVDFEMVDLGLSVKWATCNLGASSPEEYGNHYAWGETEPKDDYSLETYKWCMGSLGTHTKYCGDPIYGYNGFVDYKMILDPEDDAAAKVLGGSWRMPKLDECLELLNNCTTTWTTLNGVYGRKFSSNITGFTDKWIFIPASGFRSGTNLSNVGEYGFPMSSSLGTIFSGGAQYLCGAISFSEKKAECISSVRYCGHTIRPVCDVIRVTGVSLYKSDVKIFVNDEEKLTVNVIPSDAENLSVTWTSSNEAVATVNSDGLVAAIGVGNAVITATTVDGGFTAECTVTVEIPPMTDLGKTFVPVDLGLPSGLKWASFNLGATKPEGYGDYFAWGETEPKEDYSRFTYRWCMGSGSTMTKYCSKSEYGYNGFTDNKTVLDPEDDAAAVALGGSWRMATLDEWDELINKCTWTWTSQYGVNGRLVTGPNGNSIFLPAAGYWEGTFPYSKRSWGYYWSSSLYTDTPDYAYSVDFYSSNVYWSDGLRFSGRSVRPVSE